MEIFASEITTVEIPENVKIALKIKSEIDNFKRLTVSRKESMKKLQYDQTLKQWDIDREFENIDCCDREIMTFMDEMISLLDKFDSSTLNVNMTLISDENVDKSD